MPITFKMFLNEYRSRFKSLTDVDKFVESVLKDCQPFLKNFKNLMEKEKYLIRSLEDSSGKSKEFFRASVRKNRRPLDTNQVFHNIADEWFKKNFDFNYRSAGLFCTLDEGFMDDFQDSLNSKSSIYIIFPIGNYELCYSRKISDLFTGLFRDLPYTISQKLLKIKKVKSPVSYLEILFGKDFQKSKEFVDVSEKSWFGFLSMLLKKMISDIEDGDTKIRDIIFLESFWLRSMDLTSTEIRSLKDRLDPTKGQEVLTVLIDDLLDQAEYVKSKKISRIPSGEVMVKCDHYYAMALDDVDSREEIIGKILAGVK